MTVEPWQALAGIGKNEHALVIGNGPSRASERELANRFADAPGAIVIACNAYWRECKDGWPIYDYLVCYDALQTRAAMEEAPLARFIVPEQRDDSVRVDIDPSAWGAVYEAAPHRGTGRAEDAWRSDWTPSKMALGNLSGLLAYQAAMIMGCCKIHLLGVDCGGLLKGDQVRLSSVGEATLGYGPIDVPRERCNQVGGSWLPGSWDQYRSLWRALTRRSSELGIETLRLVDAGSLDWIPVRR